MQAHEFAVVTKLASDSLMGTSPRLSNEALDSMGLRGGELLRMLKIRNGFYAFESALHVLPAGTRHGVMDLETWNSPELWRSEYGELANGCFFFAEDIFGGQFCVRDGQVYVFDPETGELALLASGIGAWVDRVIAESDVLTGYSMAHAWQERHGPLEPGKRLLPKKPFVLGGAFDVSNLYAETAAEGMRFRGHLATKIARLPDGSKVTLKVTE